MKRINTTLCCVVNKERQEILMVVSKRGWGSGKYNFPGGKSQEQESFFDCAVRETFEETGITTINPQFVGLLEFYWSEEDKLVYNEVYYTEEFSGKLKKENEECSCLWVPISEIPFEKMWSADKIWVPEMFDKQKFHFEFVHHDKISDPVCTKVA